MNDIVVVVVVVAEASGFRVVGETERERERLCVFVLWGRRRVSDAVSFVRERNNLIGPAASVPLESVPRDPRRAPRMAEEEVFPFLSPSRGWPPRGRGCFRRKFPKKGGKTGRFE